MGQSAPQQHLQKKAQLHTPLLLATSAFWMPNPLFPPFCLFMVWLISCLFLESYSERFIFINCTCREVNEFNSLPVVLERKPRVSPGASPTDAIRVASFPPLSPSPSPSAASSSFGCDTDGRFWVLYKAFCTFLVKLNHHHK